ncbi:MAG: alkaline phosphatase family protein [Candidatus Omnitrophica bacterium]|nr:alkaline phosphatase family protein [Candidatus Omnitrophota bacterium]
MLFAYIDPGSGFTISSLGTWLITFLFAFLCIFFLFFKKIFGFLKNFKRRVIIILLVIITLYLTITGVIMSKKEPQFDKKVIILGFDGLSPEIIEPMMREGRLPNFSRLKEQGSYRRLTTTNPSQSPVAWAGFATGQNPGKNGIFDFIVRDPRTYKLDLSLSSIEKGKPNRVIKSKCFWQYTSEEKIPSVIITCPVTFPPDKIYGRMLSGIGVPDILGTEGTFTFYTTESLNKNKDIRGKVFQVGKTPVMIMNLIGPKVAALGGKTDNVRIPFKIILQEDKNSVIVEYQKHRFELKTSQWSDWKEVSFKLGLFRKVKGIFKFYLVETEPEFKLYISPINFDPRGPFFQISYPKNYSRLLADNIGLYYTQGMPIDTWAVNEKRLTEKPLLEQANEVLREKKAMLDFELNRFKKGILFCYFESPDIIQHMFWRYTDPEHPLYEENAPREYKEMIQNWYKKMDDTLGSVIKRINKKDTLIILSDHGFNTFRRAVHVNSWLRKNGYLELKNPKAESGGELLMDIDWSKTKAYAIGFGAIYINQEGRERDGIVKPGKETELLKGALSQKLKEWHDEKHNKTVVNKIYKREEIFWGNYAHNTPDLCIGFNIGYRASWQTALGAAPKELIEDNLKKWSGSHLFDPSLMAGIIFSNKKITKESPSIYDITPTILEIIGYDEEKIKDGNFDGTPLF